MVFSGGVTGKIIERLIEADGKLVTREELIWVAYSENLSKTAIQAFAGSLRNTKLRVLKFGWEITSVVGGIRNQKVSYKLTKLEPTRTEHDEHCET